MKKDSLQTVTVKGWSWKWNSSDYFFHSSKKYAVCFITGIIFLLSKLTSWLRKEPASFEFSLVQFCKELDIYTQCVCACVCVLFTRTCTVCFLFMTKHLWPQNTKQSCSNVKDPAFYQLWEAMCITVKIQILHSRFRIFTKGLWRTCSSETIPTFSGWRIEQSFWEWYPLSWWRRGENTP